MDIQKYPNEVIQHICGFLGQPELLVISLTCKHIHLLAEPSVYARFLEKDPAATPLLLRTIFEKPYLRFYFRALVIQSYTTRDEDFNIDATKRYPPDRDSVKIWKHLHDFFTGYWQAALSVVENIARDTDSHNKIFEGHQLNAFLILLLPRLESIIFDGYYQDNPYILELFSRASQIQLGAEISGNYSLTKLKELSFLSQPESTAMNEIWPMMELQSLRVFLFDYSTARGGHHGCLNLTAPCQIQHLTLRGCNIPLSEFKMILPSCNYLQYLHIEGTESQFRLTEFINLLSSSQNTLHEIKIINFQRDEDNMRPFPSFQQFQKLQRLTIECDLLNHVEPDPRADQEGVIPRYLTLENAFPPSLEYLKVCNADPLSPLLQLIKWNVNRLQAVPLLKKMVVEFIFLREPWVEKYEGWKDLPSTFAQSGMELEMWTSEGREWRVECFVENRLEGGEWVDGRRYERDQYYMHN